MIFFRHVALLSLLVGLAACARHMPPQDPESVARVWSVLHPRVSDSDRLSARFSLHVETKDRAGRLLGQLWGCPAMALRLDMTSGAGDTLVMIRETPELWIAYVPSEKKAYHHAQAQAGLALFQIPVPFDARQISGLLAGDVQPILGREYSRVEEADGRLRFVFTSGEVAFLEVPRDLSTLFFQGRSGWTLTCELPESSPVFPDRQLYEKWTFASPKQGRAVLRVKSLEPGGTWQAGDLDLNLPGDTQWMRILSGRDT